MDVVIKFRIKPKLSLVYAGKALKTFEVSSSNPLATNLDLTFNFSFTYFSELTHKASSFDLCFYFSTVFQS